MSNLSFNRGKIITFKKSRGLVESIRFSSSSLRTNETLEVGNHVVNSQFLWRDSDDEQCQRNNNSRVVAV